MRKNKKLLEMPSFCRLQIILSQSNYFIEKIATLYLFRKSWDKLLNCPNNYLEKKGELLDCPDNYLKEKEKFRKTAGALSRRLFKCDEISRRRYL